MTFRTRLLLAFVPAVLLLVAVLAYAVRRETTERLTTQYERRVEARVGFIRDDITAQGEAISRALATVRRTATDDNRFRNGLIARVPSQRSYVIDFAGNAMQFVGLSMLQIQDENGRIISSGHFRNEYDRLEPALPTLLRSLDATDGSSALFQARTPQGPLLVFARVDSFTLGGKNFDIIGGVAVDTQLLTQLARDKDLSVSISYPGGYVSSLPSDDNPASALAAAQNAEASNAIVRELVLPFVDADSRTTTDATFRVAHPLTELQVLRRSIDRWFLLAVAAIFVLSVIVVGFLASRVSRPLVDLARRTSRVDLDSLDVRFESKRKDEIGALTRVLAAMTERLRTSASKIKDAERRATLGELARQVNHDVKNGLIPIRNVFRHLSELSDTDPHEMQTVFRERKGTVESSISYLEDLAANYARLSPRRQHHIFDVNDIVRAVVPRLREAGRPTIAVDLKKGALVQGDSISLRRVLENLIGNAIDSMRIVSDTTSTAHVDTDIDRSADASTDAGIGANLLQKYRPGAVSISTRHENTANGTAAVRITIADSGPGMTADQVTRAFDNFYTTKPGGTGLGLSIVRRLVTDLDGELRVESQPGRGTRVDVVLPAAPDSDR